MLKDKRNNFYQNINICKDNCNYNKINHETQKVSCNCDTSYNNFHLTEQILKKIRLISKIFFQINSKI